VPTIYECLGIGTAARDPLVLTAVCLVVAVAGLISAYLPALRAAGMDPKTALHEN